MKLWQTSELEELRQLWTGGLSATEIGVKLNRSRNAVIGRLDRQGLLGEERYKNRTSTITLAQSAQPLLRARPRSVRVIRS